MLIAFDLDGTLIDAREIHFECFNLALGLVGCEPILLDEHLRRFDGLPTAQKMRTLIDDGRLPDSTSIWRAVEAEKHRLTLERIVPDSPDPRIMRLFEGLRDLGHRTAVVSNARWQTVNRVVEALRISPDVVISNEDVRSPKPSPEGYLTAMVQTGNCPASTLVLEDAPAGKRAARSSGARMVPVFDPADITLDEVVRYIDGGSSFDVVIPMAGDGRRFREAGHRLPKPLIDVGGRPMISRAVGTLDLPEARHIFLVRKSHADDWAVAPILRSLVRDVEIIEVDSLTDGAARTVLLARGLVDSSRPCVIANSDQSIDWQPDEAIHRMISKRWDAAALIFDAPDRDKKWSYAQIHQDRITRTAEKEPISDHALCGVFMYRRGRDMIRSIDMMIEHGERVNGEWYVAPSMNHLAGSIGAVQAKMSGLGTPDDLQKFLGR